MTLRDKIRGLPKKALTVLGEAVEVRGLSAAAMIALEDAVPRREDGTRDLADVMVGYVVACTFAPGGERVFADGDAAWLKTEADGPALRALFAAAADLNGLGGGEKNSATGPSNASPSASP